MDLNIESMSVQQEADFQNDRATSEYFLAQLMDMFVYQIRRRMQELGWTEAKLAAEAEMTSSQIRQLISLPSNPSIGMIAEIATALDLEFQALKMIPREQAGQQVEEFGPFVRAADKEGDGSSNGSDGVWWPVTNKRPTRTDSVDS